MLGCKFELSIVESRFRFQVSYFRCWVSSSESRFRLRIGNVRFRIFRVQNLCFEFTLQVSVSRVAFQVSISDLDFRFRCQVLEFKLWTPGLEFRCYTSGFDSGLNFMMRCQVLDLRTQTSTVEFMFSFQVSFHDLDFNC